VGRLEPEPGLDRQAPQPGPVRKPVVQTLGSADGGIPGAAPWVALRDWSTAWDTPWLLR